MCAATWKLQWRISSRGREFMKGVAGVEEWRMAFRLLLRTEWVVVRCVTKGILWWWENSVLVFFLNSKDILCTWSWRVSEAFRYTDLEFTPGEVHWGDRRKCWELKGPKRCSWSLWRKIDSFYMLCILYRFCHGTGKSFLLLFFKQFCLSALVWELIEGEVFDKVLVHCISHSFFIKQKNRHLLKRKKYRENKKILKN